MKKKTFVLSFFGNFCMYIGAIFLFFVYTPILQSEILYSLHKNEYQNRPQQVVVKQYGPESENIQPLQTNQSFSIIISKINLNAPIVPNVTTVNRAEYMEALRYGVAHAKGTALPGENGNSFLFAHSSLNFWQLGPYATVFNLLHKISKGDTIIIIHDKKPYLYKVFSTEIVPGWNTKPFDDEYPYPVLTLVTCDPPGSTLNRRIVKARLVTDQSRENQTVSE